MALTKILHKTKDFANPSVSPLIPPPHFESIYGDVDGRKLELEAKFNIFALLIFCDFICVAKSENKNIHFLN